jgi:tetratricopeptide (TPR) repeat protein
MRFQKTVVFLLLAAAILLTAIIYRPGLSGSFVFDDGLNIVNNPRLHLEDLSIESLMGAAKSSPSGDSLRPLSMLSFALNFYFDQDVQMPFASAHVFKLTNLCIHLLNGLLVFCLTWFVATAKQKNDETHTASSGYSIWLALAVSTAWLLHPLNLTGVLYVVQRMASLAALFTYAGLTLYVWGRIRLSRGQVGGKLIIITSLMLFSILATLSKENGILLPLFALITEAMLFHFDSKQAADRRFLIGLFSILVGLPMLWALSYTAIHPEWILAGYEKRDFDLPQRLMTECRVIWLYIRMLVVPDISKMGLYHDDYAISRSMWQPPMTVPAAFAILVMPYICWRTYRFDHLVAYGLVFFFAGHVLESTVFPLELVHEHRNYLPDFGLLLAFFHVTLKVHKGVGTHVPRILFAILLVTLFAVNTRSRTDDWSSPSKMWSAETAHHPNSARANLEMADLYANMLTFDASQKEENYASARAYYEKALALNTHRTESLFNLIKLSQTYGQPMERSWLIGLAHALSNETIPPSTSSRLVALANCGNDSACPLWKNELEDLLYAPLSNPHVVGREKALIYSALIYYQFNIRHDYSLALDYTQKAMVLDADIEYQFWLVSIYIAKHQVDVAKQQLEIIKKLDKANGRRKDINSLATQLEKIRQVGL